MLGGRASTGAWEDERQRLGDGTKKIIKRMTHGTKTD
jgi:hypothetical protein